MAKTCQTMSCHLASQQTEQNQGNGYKYQGFDNMSNAKAHKSYGERGHWPSWSNIRASNMSINFDDR